MRARSRRSASNYLSAAILELCVMGIFVIIAQPQLRQALGELIPQAVAAAAQTPTPSHLRDTTAANALRGLAQLAAVPPSQAAVANNSINWSTHSAGYAPLDYMESFAVSVEPTPSNQSQPAVQQRVARYAPSQSPTQAATQLNATDWNIAAAAQSPRPLSGWTAPNSSETSYRDAYPPPYGTQSQWK